MAEEDPEVTMVRLAKEEEGIGNSAGAHLAGVNSALLMQNHGFLAAINPIVSLALLYEIPLPMLISPLLLSFNGVSLSALASASGTGEGIAQCTGAGQGQDKSSRSQSAISA